MDGQMITLVHFSEDIDFAPDPERAIEWEGEKMCYFYESPTSKEQFDEMQKGWAYRNAYFFEINRKYIEESICEEGIQEYIVRPENYDKLIEFDADCIIDAMKRSAIEDY